MQSSQTIDLDKITPLPAGPLLKVGSKLLPGVAKVQNQIIPYADAWRESNKYTLSQSGPLWVVLGDSMSQGIGASSYDSGWVNQLQDTMRESGINYRILNLSMTGGRIEHVTNIQIPTLLGLGVVPDMITILVGANDIISPRYRRRALDNYHQLLKSLPDAKIFISPPADFGVGVSINALLRQYTSQNNTTIVSNNITNWHGKLSEDHFHPNNRGYGEIAQAFADSILDK